MALQLFPSIQDSQMAKKLDVTKPGAGKGHGPKMPAVHPKGLAGKHSQAVNGSAKVKGVPQPKLSPAYNLFKKFDY